MGSFYIKGAKKLCGEVNISGSKNEALKLIPLAICIKSEISIGNVPKILDINSQLDVFKFLGGKVEFNERLILDSRNINNSSIVCESAKSLRASIVYLGPLLARFKRAQIPFPGGCAIGLRPIDTHLNAFRALGANVTHENDTITLTIDDIKTEKITLDERSVSATENILLFLSAINCKVLVSNCAIEPEIMHLVGILNNAGARIRLVNDRMFKVEGCDNLTTNSIEVMPDRIEAGTFAIAFLATGGEGEIKPFESEFLKNIIDVLRECGANIEIDSERKICRIKSSKYYKTFSIKTGPYPGFPTDLQSPMALIASRAQGVSEIHETMFENRLGYLESLGKMGMKYKIIDKSRVQIYGPCDLKSSNLESLDLRSGITMLLAGIMAEGESVIKNAEVIDRGYENIEEKLIKLGADIKRSDG